MSCRAASAGVLAGVASFLAAWLGSTMAWAEETLCARAKVEILQEVGLERSAFLATLRVNNGFPDLRLENLRVDVGFSDAAGVPVTASADPDVVGASFFVRVDSLQGTGAVDGTGVVEGGTTAEATWLIVPAAGAARGVSAGTLYYVGARLTYRVGNEERVTEVTPDFIYVKPQPRIALDYFLAGDVFGDDAWTSEVEAPVPLTLGVRVKNNGLGVARSFEIESAQPRIVENEQGLLVGFRILGSETNGAAGGSSLKVSFGDIAPQGCGVARWLMECTLSGRMTDLAATCTHGDEFGGQMTSLVEATGIHLLVRDVLVDVPGRDGLRDFLATDGAALRVYESEGIDTACPDQSGYAELGTGVAVADEVEHRLAGAATAGFSYVKVGDPYLGAKGLRAVVRADGKRLRSENAWLSKERAADKRSWNYYLNVFDVGTDGVYSVVFGDVVGNQAPEIAAIPDQVVAEGHALTFNVVATDPDGTVPTSSVEALPVGATFASGVFTWTPVVGQAGSYEVVFRATDGQLSVSAVARILVRSASDIDGDGLPDAWELQWFSSLDRDGTGDQDGDGLTDFREWQLGTDPGTADGTTWCMGRTVVDGLWKTVTLTEHYACPVVIVGAPGRDDAAPGVVRVRGIGTAAFAVRFQEWDYLDGVHGEEQLTWLVVPAGRTVLAAGTVVEAGTFEANGTWQGVSFGTAFAGVPRLFLTVQTEGDAQAVAVRARSLGPLGFEAALVEQKANTDGHGNETVGYLAILGAQGSVEVNGQPAAFETMGAAVDQAWTKVGPAVLMVEDEQSAGAGTAHAAEAVDALVVDGHQFAQVLGVAEADPCALRSAEVDSDGDELVDAWEILYFGGLDRDGTGDADGDGLTDGGEYAAAGNPMSPDTDGDGMPDGWEQRFGLALRVPDGALDPDGDGLTNLEEYQGGWDPRVPAPVVSAVAAVPSTGLAPLDVSFSAQVSGAATTWAWSFGDGGTGVGETVVHRYEVLGTFVAQVLVDGVGGSGRATVGVEVGNEGPVAEAGTDVDVEVGATAWLDGTASRDPNDEIVEYRWTQVAGTGVQLVGADQARASFVAPAVEYPGEALGFQLRVVDRFGASAADTVVVNVTVVNSAPVAQAGPDLAVAAGQAVTLDGAGSSDADDGIVSWTWRQVAGPPVTLAVDEARASFTAPIVGRAGETLEFELEVADHRGATAVDGVRVLVTFVNREPLAVAGPDQSVLAGQVAMLDGTGSSDPEGPIAAWQWRQVSGQPVVLFGAEGPQAQFMAPVVAPAGETLEFELRVTDQDGATATDVVAVYVGWVNLAPVAVAGADQAVGWGDVVRLDGFGSYDPDGAVASYRWEQTGGPAVALSGASAAIATFEAPLVPLPGATMSFLLSVADTHGATSSDGLTVYVTGVNLPPVAEAGPNQSVQAGEVVTLNGLNSYDPDGAVASYRWAQTTGPAVVLSGAASALVTFVAPTVAWPGAALDFELSVTDTFGAAGADRVLVNVLGVNRAPVALAGPDQTVGWGQVVQLDGSGSSDPDDGLASFAWRQIAGEPVVELSDATAQAPTFRFPEPQTVDLSLTFELTVTDRHGLQASDQVVVNAAASNLPPVAAAGADQTVAEGTTVLLDGTASRDPDAGDSVAAYAWRQVSGPSAVLSSSTTASPTFVPVPVPAGVVTTASFELTVWDASGLAGTDLVVVAVQDNGIRKLPADVLPFFGASGKHLGVLVTGDAALVALYPRDPDTIVDQVGRPDRLPYGLVDVLTKVAVPGAAVEVALYLPSPAPKTGSWFTWDAVAGWQQCDDFSQLEDKRGRMTMTLVDGGQGDADGKADGLITMTGGVGSLRHTGH